MIMKEFDWEKAKECHRPEVVKWLKSIHDKKTTLEEYVEGYRGFRAADPRPYRCKRYGLSQIRYKYNRLKKVFGFFS